ncbi:MAG TPA: M23 family metallopeptidase [Chitinophagaceae bacterium]|nr:M23 family metallopeptidase [Chitinophagaceae bacterium]
MFRSSICLVSAIVLLFSCRTGTGIFGKKTPHEQYADKLSNAGLKETALGHAWFQAAEQSLSNPLQVTIPYKETGYFAADRPQAAGLRFQARRGEKLNITLSKKPAAGFAVYMELWKAAETADKKPRLEAVADTNTLAIEHEVDDEAAYIIRIQPELLKGGEYTLSISAGPSLAYPIKAPGKNHIQSFWGDPRDAGGRSHEGIDMFAPRRTPVVAAADGRVTRVNENNLGGKVVWMRPDNKNYVLYYAHLDEQLVTDGQVVKIGDTLGLMGNTGNARSTAPHLHFGIYGPGGAVDPFPFVNPTVRIPANVTAPVSNVGKFVRAENRQAKLYAALNGPSISLDQHVLMQVEAATADWYKIRLPDGRLGLLKSNQADALTEIRKLSWKEDREVFDMPDSLAARKTTIKGGTAISVLAAFNDYYYIRTPADVVGWIKK